MFLVYLRTTTGFGERIIKLQEMDETCKFEDYKYFIVCKAKYLWSYASCTKNFINGNEMELRIFDTRKGKDQESYCINLNDIDVIFDLGDYNPELDPDSPLYKGKNNEL